MANLYLYYIIKEEYAQPNSNLNSKPKIKQHTRTWVLYKNWKLTLAPLKPYIKTDMKIDSRFNFFKIKLVNFQLITSVGL